MNCKRNSPASLWRRAALATAALALMTVMPAFAADVVIANVPFAFKAGAKSLPAGEYEFVLHPNDEVVAVSSTTNPKGPSSMVGVVTMLASPTSGDARVVFDKVGGQYILSEVRQPEGEGILVQATKGRHEHHVVKARKK